MQPITHPALANDGISHGFFTREGGVSEGIYASLNCGPGSNDAPDNVTENRTRIARWFGPEAALNTCYQIHSATVVTLDTALTTKPEADAMVTKTPDLVLGILTADCAPVLFADAKAKVIGAAHAGWKGAFTDIVENTVSAMEALGANRTDITAVIGPCIGPESYEVGEEFVAHFIAEDNEFKRFFREGRVGHAWFDLPAFVLSRCEKAGIQAEWCGADTLPDERRFFSYRRKTLRGEPDYGRQISAICLTQA